MGRIARSAILTERDPHGLVIYYERPYFIFYNTAGHVHDAISRLKYAGGPAFMHTTLAIAHIFSA